jgi:hypothetical protein
MKQSDIDTAMDVLLWLHERTEEGRDRDAISKVREMLWDIEGEAS